MFKLKTKILFGKGCLSKLDAIEGKKAVIFSSNSMEKYGFLDEVLEHIKMPYALIKNIKPEPDEKNIENYVKILDKENADIIIAIGGGSVIDTAKASLFHYKNAKLIAIPSTSGSGSEVTGASVLKNEYGIKYSIVADYLIPEYAFLDARLPEKMNSRLAANTGMDALTHAIEAYVSKFASPFSDAFAIMSAKKIFHNLYDSVKGNSSAREIMHYASCMAGIAILNARVGLCHAMSHKLGMSGLSHGLLNAILIDYVIEYNMKDEYARKRYDEIANELHLKNDELIKAIRELKKKIGIKKLKNYIREEEFNNMLEFISKEAALDNLMKFNPVKASKEEIKEIYEKAYYG